MSSSSFISVLALSVAAAAIACSYGPAIPNIAAESAHEIHEATSTLRASFLGLPKELGASKRELSNVPKRIEAEAVMTALDARTAGRTTRGVLDEAPERIARLSVAEFFLAAALIFFAILVMRPRKKDVVHHRLYILR